MEASASGKLAPHRIAGGSTAKRQRARSSWKLIHGLVASDGFTGQNGIHADRTYDVHVMPATRSSWHQPNASRGRVSRGATIEPTLLPMPRPVRKTASTSANV